MMMYGGTELELKNGCKKENHHTSNLHPEELFSYRDGYQMMFEEYFQKYRKARAREEAKYAQMKTVRYDCDEKIGNLNTLLAAKERDYTELKKESILKDDEIERLKEEINIDEAKVECVYQKKMAEENKAEALKVQLLKSEKKIKGFVTSKCILMSKIQGMEKGLNEYREEVKLKEEENEGMLQQIKTWKLSYNYEHYQKLNEQNKELRKTNMELKYRLNENNKGDSDVLNKTCSRFRKSKKSKILNRFRQSFRKTEVINVSD